MQNEILIRKHGIISNKESYAKVKFLTENDSYFIEITEFIDKDFSFEYFNYGPIALEGTNFYGIIEIKEFGVRKAFELVLTSTSNPNKAEVFDDNELKAMKTLLNVYNLEKDLKTNEPTKNIKKKI